MKYPDFSDRNTRTGTLGIVAVGALILAAPFVAQAATEEGDPATTEVSAGGVTLHDADGNALQCTQTSANDSAGDGKGTWRWDCDGTKIQLRTDYTMTDEAGVYAVHRNDISVAAVERGDLTVYAVAPDDAGREIVERLVAEEAK